MLYKQNMISFFNDNKIYIVGIIIVLIVIAYFAIDYQIKNTLYYELRKIEKENIRKIKKIKQQKLIEMQKKQQAYKQTRQTNQGHDGDSYIDPAQDIYNDDEQIEEEKRSEKLSKDNFMMRDLI